MGEERRTTFIPPLFLQRAIWILDILREEEITDILDVGCGDGSLLGTLCNPAPWLSSPQNVPEKFKNLHLRHIRGLDISKPDLEIAVQFTSPPAEITISDEPESRYTRPRMRWEPLLVEIWKGGLEVVNPEFIGVDVIVSSEVIEHLPEEIFPWFAPVLLGVYQPRFFLVTTPSYTFNARFSTPDELAAAEAVRPGGHIDPTGRTSRVFRHPDHKFEWTVEEFTDWCTTVAREWGYHVRIDGIGKPVEKDEWGRDDQLGFASQAALFTRIKGEEVAKARQEEIGKTLGKRTVCDHELLARHHHLPHPHSGVPLEARDILDKIKGVMERSQDSVFTVQALWNEDEIAYACAGHLDKLVDAVAGCEEFLLHRNLEGWREEWQVELIGGVQPKQNLWTKEEQDSDDEFPAVYSSESEESEIRGVAEVDHGYSWGMPENEVQTDWGGSWGGSSPSWPSGSGWEVAHTEEVN